ncbi:hypothetical protein [Kineosporia sp. NBRC 101731]|uniref:hypothetical protein n=1 Tax=Kineosporia sp. NBRC 101731 TaxID=3032199 RepID=UPI0024A23DAB|nr:hypothetical protein [Kineosporia sp. NBRC 101731]GLY32561.1 hypothetical protein Kisp02_59260 [Kineosporia sp. NBRC 101731]
MTGPRLGRADIAVGDELSGLVVWLEFVFRSYDITVWSGRRTLAVMDRDHFAAWLDGGADLVIDDLAWSRQGGRALLTIDGHHTYPLDHETLAVLKI